MLDGPPFRGPRSARGAYLAVIGHSVLSGFFLTGTGRFVTIRPLDHGVSGASRRRGRVALLARPDRGEGEGPCSFPGLGGWVGSFRMPCIRRHPPGAAGAFLGWNSWSVASSPPCSAPWPP